MRLPWRNLIARCRALRQYAIGLLIGREDLDPDIVQDTLLLVLDADREPVPTVEEIAAWTPAQRREAAAWAWREHLYANDHDDVERLPRPDVLRPREAP